MARFSWIYEGTLTTGKSYQFQVNPQQSMDGIGGAVYISGATSPPGAYELHVVEIEKL